MNAYISFMTLYRYDNSLFDTCYFPPDAAREVIIAELLASTAELEVIYPDFDAMKMMLEIYTKSRANAWQKTFEALTASYNPIWNKDGTIEEITHTANTGSSNSSTNAQNDGYVTAYNSNVPQQNTRDTAQSAGTFNSTASGDQSVMRIEKGNIGVTKSQEMVTDEVVLRASYDITHIITADIKRRFCLMVY